jgi:serine/threonine protein kinase
MIWDITMARQEPRDVKPQQTTTAQQKRNLKELLVRVFRGKKRVLGTQPINKPLDEISAEQSDKQSAITTSPILRTTMRRLEQIYAINRKLSRKKGSSALSVLQIGDRSFALERASRKTGGLDTEGNHLPGFLGQGQEGVVKLGRDIHSKLPVAVKIYDLPDDQEEREEIIADIKQTEGIERKLEQIVISGVVGKTDQDGNLIGKAKYYKVMNVALGKEFAKFLDKFDEQFESCCFSGNEVKIHEIQKEMLQLMLILLQETKEMHDKGIVHGDINSHNIYWDNKSRKFTFIDFGRGCDINTPMVFAHVFQSGENPDHYAAPEIRVTEAYVSQEKLLITTAADVYSLGWMFDNHFMRDVDYFYNSQQIPALQRIKKFVQEGMLATSKEDRPTIEKCIGVIQAQLTLFENPNSQKNISNDFVDITTVMHLAAIQYTSSLWIQQQPKLFNTLSCLLKLLWHLVASLLKITSVSSQK